jgi:hypothetical protein
MQEYYPDIKQRRKILRGLLKVKRNSMKLRTGNGPTERIDGYVTKTDKSSFWSGSL